MATTAVKFAAGGTKYSFDCAKRVFSLLVSPNFDKFSETLICEEIVLKMNLPMYGKKCETVSINGIKTEAVGFIKTTVQCLKNGSLSGTMYIKARVVRDFYKLFGSDGLCGEMLKQKLKIPASDECENDLDDTVDDVIRDNLEKRSKVKKKGAKVKESSKKAKNPEPTRLDCTSPSFVPQCSPPGMSSGKTKTSTPKSNNDVYTNQSQILQGCDSQQTKIQQEKKYACFHLGRPIPSELMSVAMPHGNLWCNPTCTQQTNIPENCGYFDYQGERCSAMCPGKLCPHNSPGSLGYYIPPGNCAPDGHKLFYYHGVVDYEVDTTPPASPPPACQGNYIQYSVLNPIYGQRSPGGGPLLKWTPWYYDRKSHEYSYTMPEDFDPDGSFHSVRSMDSLASSNTNPGLYATDGSSLYKLEDISYSQASPEHYTVVDQAIVHKMFTSGKVIPDQLQHVPIPHGEQWCTSDCPHLGFNQLPYDCGYHPDWGQVISCMQTCPGGWCSHYQDQSSDWH